MEPLLAKVVCKVSERDVARLVRLAIKHAHDFLLEGWATC